MANDAFISIGQSQIYLCVFMLCVMSWGGARARARARSPYPKLEPVPMSVPVPWARTNTGIQFNIQLFSNNIVTVAHSVGYT